MLDLCLDTSMTTAVALVNEGKVLARTHNDSSRDHAESIAALVMEAATTAGLPGALKDIGIGRVLVGTGPAPFTGLRAGLVSARAIARACDAEIYGVSSLEIIARQALDLLPPDKAVVAFSDARRRELYWSHVRALGPDDVEVVVGPEVGSAQTLVDSLVDRPAFVVSCAPVPAHCAEVFADVEMGPIMPLDTAVLSRIVDARLAHGQTDRLGTEPLYLRRPEIQGQPMERM